jgi:hypothetical protein
MTRMRLRGSIGEERAEMVHRYKLKLLGDQEVRSRTATSLSIGALRKSLATATSKISIEI